MLDIYNFECLYNPNEKTVNTSLFKIKQSKRQNQSIGMFNFQNLNK